MPEKAERLTEGVEGRRALQSRAAWRLLLAVTVQLAFLGGLFLLTACYSAGKLTSFDCLALPGETIALRVKVENDGPGLLNPDVKGLEVEFLRSPRPRPAPSPPGSPELAPDPLAPFPPDAVSMGVARSGSDGVASLEFKAPSSPGNHLYWARLREEKALTLREPFAPLMVCVLAAKEPVIITDIDNTIVHSELGPILGDRPEEIAPLEAAPETLQALSLSHRIVYLTARSTYLAHRTRRWLAVHRFPAGPVLLRDVGREFRSLNLDEGEFKRRVIAEEIRKRDAEIRWGIGNTENDVKAYGANGIRGLIIGYDPDQIPAQYRPLVRNVSGWDEVRKIALP